MNADSIYIVDCAGAIDNSGNSYAVVEGTTCIVVDRSDLVGYNLDTLCVVTIDTTTGITDTTVVIISNLPSKDTIRDTNIIFTTDTICAAIDNGMSNIVTTISDCAGAIDNSGNTYTADENGCIIIDRSEVVGYNLDTLCIIKTDTITGISDTTVAIISNLSDHCDFISDTTITCNFNGEGDYCIPLDLNTIQRYHIYIDGTLSAQQFSSESGCGEAIVEAGFNFEVIDYVDNVPHLLEVWGVNSTTTLAPMVNFSNLTELASYMNSVDASGMWFVDGLNIKSANPNLSYSTGTGIHYFAWTPEASTYTAQYNNRISYSATKLTLTEGCHEVILVDTMTGCSDTAQICIVCPTCDSLIVEDTIDLVCDNYEGKLCLPIPMNRIEDYNIYVSGDLYTSGIDICDEQIVGRYSINAQTYVDGIPHTLEQWIVNDSLTITEADSVSFTTLDELVAYMNSVNPEGAWRLNGLTIYSDNPHIFADATDTIISIFSVSPLLSSYVKPNYEITYLGSEIVVPGGCHWVVVEDKENLCRDSVWVCVDISGCIPVDTIRDTTCYGCPVTVCLDTVQLSGTVTSISTCDGNANVEITGTDPCIVYTPEDGFTGNDTICITVCDDLGMCDTTIIIITVEEPKDTIREIIPINETDSICEFTTPAGTAITITACTGATAGVEDYISWYINEEGCLVYTAGDVKGTDTLCISACNEDGECFETTVIITVTGVPPVANNDTVVTDVNTPITITVLGNDEQTDSDPLQVCSPEGIITAPEHGSVVVNTDGTITYTPQVDYRGVDSFQYVICDPDGNDTAWVFIEIESCIIPNAISPNGDGINDTWYIPCIEESVDVVLCVYNRWGIEVYRNEAYSNLSGWDGEYKGAPLPDGTYYYVLKYLTREGEQVNKAGFIVIHR
ncbi:MAG: gliding motility-associated C-terminal domain-containing protein [Chitinophagales bacterium]